MNGLFAKLEDQGFFVGYVTGHYNNAPAAAIADFPCTHTLDQERILFAFGEYTQNIKQYSLLLDSKNPDHYKRCGAMLHALYKSKIVTSIEYAEGAWGAIDEVEAGDQLGLSYAFGQQMIKFPKFYEAFHNEVLAFDLSYQLCAAYEDNPRDYDFSFLYNMAHYLRKNKDLNVDSLSMIFRSLMI